jgi:hypothetical protein
VSDRGSDTDDDREATPPASGNGSSRSGIAAGEAIRSAREVIAEVTGKQPEGISAVNRSDDGGWAISLDVVELVRVPSSTDLLATYEVSLDADGGLVDMERSRRYARNQVDGE